MKVYEILEATKGILVSGNKEDEICFFSQDSRQMKNGGMYIPLKGERFDGHDFIESAFQTGATAIITAKDVSYPDKIVIKVEDTYQALKDMAIYLRSHRPVKVVGVTGSVGKTSTRDMVYSVVKQKYKTLKTEGNYNNEIGLPLTILRYQDEEVMVLEMGMNHLNEMSRLSMIAHPDVSCITNVGTAHIGELGSRENILKAKLEITDGMKDQSTLIINNDNDMLHEYYIKNSDNVITVGINSDSMYRAVNVRNNCLFFDIDGYLENVKNVYMNEAYIINLLVGYAVGSLLGLTNEEYLNGVKKVTLSSKRLEMVMNKYGYNIINDSYNANYDSMKVGLEYLHNINYSGRKIAVLADMLELGEYSKKIHEDVGMEVVKNKIDVLVTVGEYARYINDKAISAGFDKNNSYHFNSNIECIDFLKGFLKREDMVLFKGSNGMKLYEIIDEIIK